VNCVAREDALGYNYFMFTRKKQSFSIKIPKFIRQPFMISFLVTLVTLLLSLSVYFRIQPQIPLFYSLPNKQQHLTNKEWLFMFPALSAAINFTHILILGLLKKYDRLVLQLYAWSTVLIQIILALAIIRIVWITL
jgi:hypothetical protein